MGLLLSKLNISNVDLRTKSNKVSKAASELNRAQCAAEMNVHTNEWYTQHSTLTTAIIIMATRPLIIFV